MDKRERVIHDIERCICRAPDACRDCSKYSDDSTVIRCMEELLKDALTLLKAQEPKFVSDIAEAIIGCKPKVKVGHCPSCGVLMSETDRFCRKCGQAVKWNGE